MYIATDKIVKNDFLEARMREISFEELMRTSVNVTSVSAVEQYWKDGNLNLHHEEGRMENVLSYTIRGKREIKEHHDTETLFVLEPSEIVFISQGAPYVSYTVLEDGEDMGHTACIKFKLLDDSGEEIVIKEKYMVWRDDKGGSVRKLFSRVFDSYLSLSSNICNIKAALYGILSSMSAHLMESSPIPEEFSALLPAVKHIENNLGENTSIGELASMCFLSESYFRARFKAFSGGVSPADWRNRLRIEKSKELLTSSLWTTEMIAETLGFYDTSHFYKIYKKVTGELPRASKSGL